MNPLFFVQTVLAYGLLPHWAAMLVGMVLPPLQVFVGLALVFGALTLGADVLAASLFFTFGVAGLSAILSGQLISCGCFGSISTPVTWAHVFGVFAVGAYCGIDATIQSATWIGKR